MKTKRVITFETAEKCPLCEHRGGLFYYNDILCFKNQDEDVFIVETGEEFWCQTKTKVERDNLIITKVV